MVPELWSATGRMFCHFGPSFALLPPLTSQKMSGDIMILYKCTKEHDNILHCS